MEKLKNTIELYGRWQSLQLYVERIEAYVDTDFSLSLENSKALLESISKEICKQRGVELSAKSSVNKVLRKAFSAIGYSNSAFVTQISSALATIGQNMGNIRNDIGATAHGRTLAEIEERNQSIDELTKDFLIDSTVMVACFLIRNFESENPWGGRVDHLALDYLECQDFNEGWDNIYGEFEMGDYSYTASEILFNVDYQAYEYEFKSWEEEE